MWNMSFQNCNKDSWTKTRQSEYKSHEQKLSRDQESNCILFSLLISVGMNRVMLTVYHAGSVFCGW